MFDPDLITGKLIGKTFVSKLYLFDEIESTNDFAKINQIPNNSLIITNYQIKGRGRFERKWESEKGKNLTFTIFKKFDIEPKDQVNLNYCTAFSIFSELQHYLQQFDNKEIVSNLHIKWPNDITLNNKKIAGILIETKQGSKEFIIGAGINVNQDSFTTGNATSLFNETRKPVNINKLLIDIVISLHKNFELIFSHKYLELYGLWKRNLSLIREKVTFLAPNGQKREGIVLDFLSNGQILMNIDGRETLYNSGEIKLQI